ncbi:CaiB/BaiF CoA transferase family protein [Bermanella marisrubri]|uniref:Alpha-methylacyl-CoA racemase n=1 Tax=Bermanella marisrubri TaxID=207949 RepID=Q1N3I1_9GAMM|nr:CaiB/BaiF CoA-transferase family protein [Bermanella marisrubri]EAT12893.1 Alpha-methylacyl-CoA racemase [Oceanobacter sp. RED65] [Bermanella marisrubri]
MLEGLKILDFSTLLPGPYASLMLADMGAEVLRIESPTRPDLVRALPPKDSSGQSAAHSYLNRNKKAIALDLKKPQAKGIIEALLQEYDIVIEQFRPGVMARLGLDYDSLKVINPNIIYCSITGYGQTGDLKDRAGHDINYLALSGIADYSRRKGEKPVPQGVQIADIAGGSHHAVMGILAAVYERTQTGAGRHLDISMTDCAFSMNAMFASGYLGGGIEPKAESTMLNGGSFYDYYETHDGRYMSVGSLEPPFLMQLCQALELPDVLAKAGSQKPEDVAFVKGKISDAFKSESFEHWCEVFAKLDCCVEPVLTFAEAAQQSHAKDRGWVTASEDGIEQLSNPILHDHDIQHTGGKIGADTELTLKSLGFDQESINVLKSEKVIA